MAPPTRITRRWPRTTRPGTAATRTGTAATRPGTATAATRPGPGTTNARDTNHWLVLGRYRLHRPIGSGGFGTVWLARDERLERDVAVKVLPRARVIGGRFEREARAAARLSHPAIVTLYEAEVDDDAAYLVSELVRGPTFDELLEAGRLSDRDITRIGIALCDALEHAHSHGVVHRDVKPSNVLVPEQPSSATHVAKLTDFGVARLVGGDTLTRTGDVLGTDAYMAPEQAEGRAVGPAADLYSLALVLYEALTGVNPLATGTAAGRARRLGAHLPPLRRQRRDLPQELGRCIDLALRPRPRERGTVAELRAGLLETMAEVEDRPGIVAAPWPTHSRAAHISRSEIEPGEQMRSPLRLPWLQRLLAAAATAMIAAWLTATAFGSPLLAPAAAALIAALVVSALPRIGWLALTLTAAAALTADGRPGTALVFVLGALVPVALLPRRASHWPLAAAAPALGAVTLAGAWPALAALDPHVLRRAMLGAVGWIWLALAGLLQGHGLYTELPRGISHAAGPSLEQTVRHALWPLLHSGVLAPAVAWAAAAAVLPWIIRGPVAVRVVLVTVWSAALASATTTTLRLFHAGVAARPGAVALGAIAGGLLALACSWRGPRPQGSGSSDAAAGLA
jgi:eukaryotic-like serine/threonine-protein kinase